MNLTINKEDISINEDGCITVLNPKLKAKIEGIAAEPGADVKFFDNYHNSCPNSVAGCACQLK